VILGESTLSERSGASVGVLVAALISLVVGSHAGFPPDSRVRAGLAELGFAVSELTPTDRQLAGVATYEATDTAGRPVLVKVYGRDARDSQLVARLWRTMWYRDAGPQMATSRLRQVEHEALCTLAATRAGALTQDLLAVASAQWRRFIVLERAGRPDAGRHATTSTTTSCGTRTSLVRPHDARTHGGIDPTTSSSAMAES
jgi:hypothetical protein